MLFCFHVLFLEVFQRSAKEIHRDVFRWPSNIQRQADMQFMASIPALAVFLSTIKSPN